MAWMLSAKGSVQGQPAVIRARHIFWGAPLGSRQPFLTVLCPLDLCTALAVTSHEEHAALPHCKKVILLLFFLSVVLAPQAVGVLTFTLISKQEDSFGNTGILVSTANVPLCHVKEDAGKIVKCQQSKFGNSILNWKGRSGFPILCTGKGIPS